MKVSTIITTYNRQEFFKEAVWSVLAQKSPADEVIVVDDGSDDRTPLFADMFKGAVRYVRIAHAGISAARNAGVQAASYPWVAFLDSDDLWLPGKLKVQKKFHQDHPDVLISQTEEIWVRRGKVVNPMKKHMKRGDDFTKRSFERCLISPSCVMVHKKIFERVGLFDESLPACEDYDMWLRVLPWFEVGYIPEKLVIKRGGHADQLSRKYEAMDRFRVYAIEKFLEGEAPDEMKAMAREALLKKLNILYQGALKRGRLVAARDYAARILKYGGTLPDESASAPRRRY